MIATGPAITIGGCQRWSLDSGCHATRGQILSVDPTTVTYGNGFFVGGIDVICGLSGKSQHQLSQCIGKMITVTTDKRWMTIAVEVEQ